MDGTILVFYLGEFVFIGIIRIFILSYKTDEIGFQIFREDRRHNCRSASACRKLGFHGSASLLPHGDDAML